MKKIDIKDLPLNPVKAIGHEWMLVTAGSIDSFNTMTASWGTIGYLWNRPVAYVYIRPQRYTFEFIEKNDIMTLSFPGEKYRRELTICGTTSGRDTDKVKDTGLTPVQVGQGIGFQESYLTLELKKIYETQLDGKEFLDGEISGKFYPDNDFHKVYVCEIIGAWIK